jgi:hypothetical protein
MKRHLLTSLVIVTSILLSCYAFARGRDWFLIYILAIGPVILAGVYALDQNQPGGRQRNS